jgi:deazaflavin-dependent oxidoreductase (nitroreductase family)
VRNTFPERLITKANRLVDRLLRWGIPMGSRRTPMALLTVPGRNTGLPRSVPIALAPVRDGWRLISVYGVSDWSKNLDAAGKATITIRGSTTEVTVERLNPSFAGPILRDAITNAPWIVRKLTAKYYEAGPDSPLPDWEEEARTHPVYSLTPIPTQPHFRRSRSDASPA